MFRAYVTQLTQRAAPALQVRKLWAKITSYSSEALSSSARLMTTVCDSSLKARHLMESRDHLCPASVPFKIQGSCKCCRPTEQAPVVWAGDDAQLSSSLIQIPPPFPFASH